MATTVSAPPADAPTIPAMAAATVPPPPSPDVPVTLLRAGAALLGVYGFLITLWLAGHGSAPEPIASVREWVNRPLGIGEDFGPFALMLLLAATGFLAAATGFGTRQLVRTVLPVLVVAGLAAVANAGGLDIWTTDLGIVPLAWVIGLQVVAWLVALDQRAWPTTLVLLAVVGVLCVVADDVTRLGTPLLFLPLVLVGHVTWRVLDRTLPVWAGLLLLAGCFAAILGVDRTFDGLDRWWYPIAATYAVLVFLVAARVAGPTAATIAAHPVTRWLADRTEWLLLLGGVLGFAILEPLRDSVPVPLGMVVALAVTGVAADLGYRLTRKVEA